MDGDAGLFQYHVVRLKGRLTLPVLHVQLPGGNRERVMQIRTWAISASCAIAACLSAAPSYARFLQTDPVGYDDQVNLYAYVNNDPINRTDPAGTYECGGSKTQCAAVASAYKRGEDALKSKNLTKGERAKLQGALKALGKPGEANGVNIGFASGRDISRATGGRSDIGYTEHGDKNTINVRLNSNFGKFYDSYTGSRIGRDYSRLSPRDERAGIVAHEGRHVFQYRSGMTNSDYARNSSRYEADAYATGKLVNKAMDSVSVYDSPDDD